MNRFETMVDNYGNLIFSVCLRMTGDYFEAEDLTQETFLAAFKAASTFDGNNEKAWLCRIATNKCLDHLKRKRPVVTDIDEPQLILKDTSPPPEEDYIQKETCEQFKRLCNSLKEPYKTTAILHFIEGETAAQIAIKIGTREVTARTHIYRAKKQLQKLWKEEGL